MRFIFAKHDGCNKTFIFEVPANMCPVKNDILWVETSKGTTIAVATSCTMSCEKDGVEYIAEQLGGYMPLKKVKTYANRELQTYIENRTYGEIEAFCHDRQSNIHEFELPF